MTHYYISDGYTDLEVAVKVGTDLDGTFKATCLDYDLEDLYLDWFNNFLTVDRFAEYYGMTAEKASRVINIGRKLNHRR